MRNKKKISEALNNFSTEYKKLCSMLSLEQLEQLGKVEKVEREFDKLLK